MTFWHNAEVVEKNKDKIVDHAKQNSGMVLVEELLEEVMTELEGTAGWRG